ncbi:hypothetical protein BGX30_008642, partial [Mortierella sp. GBA39]
MSKLDSAAQSRLETMKSVTTKSLSMATMMVATLPIIAVEKGLSRMKSWRRSLLVALVFLCTTATALAGCSGGGEKTTDGAAPKAES